MKSYYKESMAIFSIFLGGGIFQKQVTTERSLIIAHNLVFISNLKVFYPNVFLSKKI